MNLILKQLIIVAITFAVVYWFQDKEDKKNKVVRKTYYEQFKLPVLISAIVGFLLNITSTKDIVPVKFEESPVIQTNPVTINPITEINKPQLIGGVDILPIQNAFDSIISGNIDQDIYTDLPDF
jgi:hypothetical protein